MPAIQIFASDKRLSFRTGLLFFTAWLGTVFYLLSHHAIWRDEGRAFNLVLQARSLFAMLSGIQGEGHPAVWYLVMRAAHTLVPTSQALQVASVGVAVASVLLIFFRSPFSTGFIAILLLSRFTVFEYSVMARNYGVTMLTLFVFAVAYRRHRDHGIVLGLILLALTNCNAHSVLLAAALLLYWLLDLLNDPAIPRARSLRLVAVNAGLAAVGLALFVVTVYPTFNDDAVIQLKQSPATLVVRAILLPGEQFEELVLPGVEKVVRALRPGLWTQPLAGIPLVGFFDAFASILLYGSLFSLIRNRAAFCAGLFSLVGFSLLFSFVYAGSYRHEALWLVFLITLYWMTVPVPRDSLAKAGTFIFLVVMLLQIPTSLWQVAEAAKNAPPRSRSKDFGAFMATRPELRQSVIIADPDALVEALNYYVPNRTYLMREKRFGNVVHYRRTATRQLTLDDILAAARGLRARTGQPVVILLAERLDPALPALTRLEAYDWKLVITPDQVRNFQSATRMVRSFAPARGDESFDVYVLD